jgi:hypothetical protein
MERARPYLKVAALVTAVGLGGAFVAYRAGAFATASPVEAQPGQPLILAPETEAEQPPPNSLQLPPAVMFGSKSAPAFTPAQPGPGAQPQAQPAPASPEKPPTFMPGSKSIGNLFPGTTTTLVPVDPSKPQQPPAPIVPTAPKP